jgi:hypothetical protein
MFLTVFFIKKISTSKISINKNWKKLLFFGLNPLIISLQTNSPHKFDNYIISASMQTIYFKNSCKNNSLGIFQFEKETKANGHSTTNDANFDKTIFSFS